MGQLVKAAPTLRKFLEVSGDEPCSVVAILGCSPTCLQIRRSPTAQLIAGFLTNVDVGRVFHEFEDPNTDIFGTLAPFAGVHEADNIISRYTDTACSSDRSMLKLLGFVLLFSFVGANSSYDLTREMRVNHTG